MGIESRTIAVTALAVLLTVVGVVLGSTAGGVSGGIIGGIAVLLSSGLVTVAIELHKHRMDRLERRRTAIDLLTVGDPDAVRDRVRVRGLGIVTLLRPEEEVVSFRRRPELDELLTWCATEAHIGVRLLTGEAGVGKTRLVVQLGRELSKGGWRTFWVPRGNEEVAIDSVREVGQPTVLVVDYAETRDRLARLLSAVADDTAGPDMRVVLLARSAGEWWQQLIADADYPVREILAYVAPIILGPLSREEAEQHKVFYDAVADFAARLGALRPQTPRPPADPYAVVLVLHAAALLAVLDEEERGNDGRQPPTSADITAGLLRHEASYWRHGAEARGLHLDSAVLRRVVAVACLAGADNEADAVVLLSCIGDLADSGERRGQVARWLHDLYPVGLNAPAGSTPTTQPGESNEAEWLGSLRPDMIAEYLVVDELVALSDLTPRLIGHLPERRIVRMLTILGRAAQQQTRAEGLLRAALAADLKRVAIPALVVAVETNPILADLLNGEFAAQPLPTDALARITAAIPYPSLVLAATAIVSLQRLLSETTERNGQRAEWLSGLSNRFGELRRPEAALDAIHEAVTIQRDLAEADPENFLPGLGVVLSNQSGRLADLGRLEEAMAVAEEAVSTYRKLIDAHPGEFQPGLALVLSNQSGALSRLGRLEDALAAIEETITIQRQLAEARPDIFLPDVATSLSNQSIFLSDLGRREAALAAVHQAVAIQRLLAEIRPDTFLPDLAGFLSNQSVRLFELRRLDEALIPGAEAITIYRELNQAHPGAFLPDFAASLNNQSICLSGLGQRDEALAAIEEAVKICQELSHAHPGAFLRNLAMVLSNQAARLSEIGRLQEALTPGAEAITIYRELNQAHSDAFRLDLAASLNNRSICLSGLGQGEDALATIEEAVAIYRELNQAHPGAFLPDLARALSNQAARLCDLGRLEKALTPGAEAIRIYRELDQAHPGTFPPDLAASLSSQSASLSELGRLDDALTPGAEAIRIYRELDQAHPGTFPPVLGLLLNNRSVILSDLGRLTEGLAAAEDATKIFRELSEVNPDTFQPGLAASLNNQSLFLSGLGRQEQALAAIEEAVAIRRHLVDIDPDLCLPDLAGSLYNLALRLTEMARHQRARVVQTELDQARLKIQRRG